MMNRLRHMTALSALLFAPMLFCAEEKAQGAPQAEHPKPKKEELLSPENVARISESYGHFVYKSLENPVLRLNFDSVIKGLNEAKAGTPSPMTEQEYEEAVSNIQEISFQEMAAKNLKDAEEFLAKNAKEEGVVELEKGKLQIKILQPGTGEEVTELTMPVLHYTGKYLDGTTFGNSYETGEPISINLHHTIPGFRQGVMGMKVGEKRRIFIHPDLGYGTSGQLLPNSLLVFEIEVTKVEPATKEESNEDESDDLSDSDDGDDISDDDSTDDDSEEDDGEEKDVK
jgi:peptidylprolyl isomerase